MNLDGFMLQVYNRKYTNLLKNLNYDSSIPQFGLMDKFNIEEYFKTEVKMSLLEGKEIEKFCVQFSQQEKQIIFILSRARKAVLVRDYEIHSNVKIINLHENFNSFKLSFDSSFWFLIMKDGRFSISEQGNDKGELKSPELILDDYKDYRISLNSRMIVIIMNNKIFTYSIKSITI